MSTSRHDRRCHRHPQTPAIATCIECDDMMCGACHGADHRGFAVCASCRGDRRIDRTAWERDDTDHSLRSFVSTLVDLLRHPRAFFDHLPARGSLYPAAAFGMICLTIGLLVGRLWQFLFMESFVQRLTSLTSQRSISLETARLSVFALTPVIAVGTAGLHAMLFKGATTLMGADCEWTTAVRITGYALGASMFLLVPPIWGFPLGRFLTIVWVFNLEISALRHYFEIGPWRSMFAALVPLLGLMVCGI